MSSSPFRQPAEREPTLRLEDRARKTRDAVMDCAPGFARSILVLGRKGYVDDCVAMRLCAYGCRGSVGEKVKYYDTGPHDLSHAITWDAWPQMRLDYYDAILAFEVLEHLLNPLLALAGAHSTLAPAGRLYVTYPRRYGPPLPCHFHEFDAYRWGELVKAADLEIEHQATFRLTPWTGRWYPSLWRWATERIYFACLKRATP